MPPLNLPTLTSVQTIIKSFKETLSAHPHYLLTLPILALFALSGYFIATNTSGINHLTHANVTPVSSTLVWTTSKPNKGCVWQLTWPLRRKCESTRSPNHLITLNNLKPSKNYTFLIRSGLDFHYLTRTPVDIPQESPGLPNPTYGRVAYPTLPKVAAHSLILITTPKGTIATQADESGRFHADLHGSYPDKYVLEVQILSTGQRFVGYSIVTGYHQPNPDFILKYQNISRSNR